MVEEELPLKQGLKQDLAIQACVNLIGWRGTSIKTRIETGLHLQGCCYWRLVEEELPLKQGLKLRVRNITFQQLRRRWRGTSIKTRIETSSFQCELLGSPVVEEELPLKQGLKLNPFFYIITHILRWRGTSIKTRIETRHIRWFTYHIYQLKRNFH